MKADLTHLSLRDLFATALEEAKKDPLQHIVALTYEFEDQQLLNLLVGRALDENYEPRSFDLKRISELAPVVIYDARKTREANLVPHFMELLPVKMPAYSCHHSKAYLVVLSDAVHLVLGSMNLTRTGLFSNREVFQHYRWSASDTHDAQLLGDFVNFLDRGYADFQSSSLSIVTENLRKRLASWPMTSVGPWSRLLDSGYGGSTGLQKLGLLWREAAGGVAPAGVFAVSPFFDKGGQGAVLAEELRKELGDFESLHIITDESCRRKIARRHFAKAPKSVLNLINEEVSKDERRRIEVANDGSAVAELALKRKLHAKILVVYGGGKYLVYVGSANFTCKAWNGANRELGVAWIKTGAAQPLIDTVVDGLSVNPIDRYDSLAESPEVDEEEDDDYQELTHYPDFVSSITLVATGANDALQFEIEGQVLERLQDYHISWGRERLAFVGGISSSLKASTVFARLMGGRNLKFTSRLDPDICYFVPFRHSATLFERREIHVHASAEDWMAYQLDLERPLPADPNEYLPGEEEPEAPVSGRRLAETRDENAMVRMQAYLSLFGRIETEFRRRAVAVMVDKLEDRAARWHATVALPLLTFGAVLQRQPEGSLSERVFKLGELAQLASSLTKPELGPLPAAGIMSLLPAESNDPLTRRYLEHCRRPDVS
jgi:hypothetical protein